MLKHGVRSDLPVALVRWATTGRQETLTGILSNIAQQAVANGFEAPAVAVFGDVVSLRNTSTGTRSARCLEENRRDANTEAGQRVKQ